MLTAAALLKYRDFYLTLHSFQIFLSNNHVNITTYIYILKDHLIIIFEITQQRKGIESVLVQYGTIVYYADPELNQHWPNLSCLFGKQMSEKRRNLDYS